MNEQDYDDAFENGNDLKEKIRRFRKSGLAKGGEYSVENLAFKALRRLGELERLSDYIDESYTKLRSIDV